MKFFSALVAALAMTTSLSATTYEEIVPGSVELLHSKTRNSFSNVSITAKLFEVFDKVILETRTWQELECEEVVSEGRGDWKNFYSLPRDEKPAALAAAIRGIGKARAEAFVYSRTPYFVPKPRSWNDLKKEIRRIENQLGERDVSVKGIYNDVIARFGAENSQNLGYATQNVNCRWVTKTEPVWVTVQERRFVRDFRREFSARVVGAKLLEGEVEKIGVSYDGRSLKFNLDGTFNSYSVSESPDVRGDFVFTGIGRKPIRPDLRDFSIQLVKENGNLLLKIKDHRSLELLERSPTYKANITFKLYKYESSWCKSNQLIVSTTQTLDGGSGSIDLAATAQGAGKNLESGGTYFVEELTLERINTEFFSGSSAEKKTDQVQL